MSEIKISIDGQSVLVAEGTSVAAAVMNAGQSFFRRSVSGEPRAAMCGMGICYECRVTVDGKRHARSCQIRCQPGMKIVTG